MIRLEIAANTQTMTVYKQDQLILQYPISTAKKGLGESWGSEQTPRGLHVVRAKIGDNCALNTVFIGRRPTGEIYTPELRMKFPKRDWILTRIFWLSGLEIGKNRLGEVDTMRRYIYIHGMPDDLEIGVPESRGCIRMRNADILDLFSYVPIGTNVSIT